MNSMSFYCEIITPMFIGNAIPKQVELRPTAIKSALRFWWRVVNANKFSSWQELLSEESKRFGSANNKLGGKSQILVSIRKETDFNTVLPDFTKEKKGFIERIKTSRGKFPSNILDYLSYGLNDYDKNSKTIVYNRYCLQPGEKFHVDIRLNKDEFLDEIIEAFVVFSNFGGLGARSRNGFGQIQLLNNDFHNAPDFLKDFKQTKRNGFISFNCDTDFIYGELHDTWHGALSEIGWAYRKCREGLDKKHFYNNRLYVAQPIIAKNETIPNFLERHSKSLFLFVNREKIKDRCQYQGGILISPYDYLEGNEAFSPTEQKKHKGNYDLVMNNLRTNLTGTLCPT